ncbi:MAG: DNA translocase FtsK [Anaerolineae bacterium]
MRYVGGDYDEFDDDEEEIEDDDELQDDEESGSSSHSRVNPFGGSSTLGSSRPSSNLPGAGRSPGAGSSSMPSSRLPGSVGASRPGSSPASGSSSGGSSPFGNRPSTPSSNSPSSSGGSSPFSRPSTPGSSSPFGGSGSGSSASGSSQFGNRPSAPGSSSPSSPSGTSSYGNRPATTTVSSSSAPGGARPATPTSSSPFGGNKPATPTGSGGSKPDDKKSGGMLGGLTGRFGGGGNKENKPAAPKAQGASSGGMLGGLTGRFGGGGNKENKPATPKAQGASSGGLLGGITGRFGGGDKKASPSSSSVGSSVSSSPFGSRPGTPGSSSTGARPAAGSSGGKSSLFGRPFGKLGGATTPGAAKPVSSSSAAGSRTGLGRFLPFGGGSKAGAASPAPAKPRTAKAPRMDEGGLTLDNKLDILGVALLLSSLALIFSRLSSTRGQLTEAVNNFLISLAGWGSIAIPVAMLVVGIWLIARHFGEEAPVVPRNRIIGIIITYIGLLVMLQFIDTFSYLNPDGSPTDVSSLRNVWLPISIARGTGGGQIGAEIYYFLVSNVTEIGAFFMILLMLIIGVMFTLDIGAAEMAMIIIGNIRSLQDARQRRQQQRATAAAASLEELTGQATAAGVTVSKESAPALPGSAAPALPSANEPAGLPAPAPARMPNITIGGKKDSVPAAPASGIPLFKGASSQSVPVTAQAAAPEKPATAGGFASRLGGMLPGRNKPTTTPEVENPTGDAKVGVGTVAAAATAGAVAGGIGRLFNRGGKNEVEKPADKPATPVAPVPVTAANTAPAVSGSAPAAPVSSAPTTVTSPGSERSGTAPASTAPEKPTRLGELMKPTAAQGAPAASASNAGATPATPRTPFAPSGSSPASGSGTSSPFGRSSTPVSPSPATPDAAKAVGGSVLPAASTAKPLGSSSPFSKSPAAASSRPEDFMDDIEDDIDDEEIEDIDKIASLPPAQPRGFAPTRPAENQSRFAPTTFNKGNTPSTANDRQGRLNELRGVANGGTSPAKPDDKPATPISQPAAASAAPRPASSPFSKPVEKPTTPDAGNKPAQPAANGSWSTPVKPYEPEKALPPKPSERPASTAFGAPTAPPGVTLTNTQGTATDGMPYKASEAREVPIGRSPEIVRPAGVGTSAPTNAPRRRKDWKLPSIAQVLMPGSEGDFDRTELLRRARIIEDTLQSFGAPGKVVEVNTGPVITQFGVEPDYLTTRSGKKNRVKVGAIAQLDKDLQLALGAKSIRIEAPVPGKGYVGIEVPNDAPSLVSLRDVMESENFQKIFNKSPLAIALGQSVDGTPISADLGSMPHLLIAGTTGSGKSVCVNSIIASLITQNPPDRVKLIMVDPKRVELTGYNGIPHLVAPVVVELERIVGVLKWVTREMDERYKKFSQAGARNIEDYNKHLGEDVEVMPYIVVIIDELADLMMLAPDETERVITRIAALARATGIHLVIATQRPSVDVVTGLIKANFPARIAFAVAGGVDSRVILDQPGAERLLGRGDMLYMSGDSPAPLRLQGVYLSDSEINNITRYWKAQVTPDDVAARPIPALVVDNSVAEASPAAVGSSNGGRPQGQAAFWDSDAPANGNGKGGDDDNISDDQEDVLYEEAVEMVRRLNKASVSLLQRRLRIGYTRAARLIDRMEEEGIVGPAVEGAKPREVLPE